MFSFGDVLIITISVPRWGRVVRLLYGTS